MEYLQHLTLHSLDLYVLTTNSDILMDLTLLIDILEMILTIEFNHIIFSILIDLQSNNSFSFVFLLAIITILPTIPNIFYSPHNLHSY